MTGRRCGNESWRGAPNFGVKDEPPYYQKRTLP